MSEFTKEQKIRRIVRWSLPFIAVLYTWLFLSYFDFDVLLYTLLGAALVSSALFIFCVLLSWICGFVSFSGEEEQPHE
jgi:hypothetical protein